MALSARVRQLFYKILGQGRGEELCDALDTYIFPAAGGTVSGAVTFSDDVTIADAQNIAVGSTTGTKIGTAATQKIGFYDANPVVQPAGADQGVIIGSTDFTGGDTVNKATVLNAVIAVENLANQLRNDLVALGLIKGSA